MAQTQLNKGDVEVDLDTDDVKAQNVQVEPAKTEPEDKEVSLQKEEVEPEGAEINRDKTPIEVETESKFQSEDDDGFDLTKASDSVQKRINKLTKARREADRRTGAALQYAQGLKTEIGKFQSQYPKMEENYLNEFEKRLQTDEVAANTLLQTAIEGQDAKSIVDANQKLTRLAIEKERLSQTKFLKEQEAKQPEADIVPPQPVNQQPQGPSLRAQEWAEKNDWFNEDDVMHDAAIAIHKNLIKSGVAGDSDEYYSELDKRVRGYFPNKFNQPQEQRKPVQTVAPAVRNQGGRKTVRLTKSQVAIAKKLGVPLEEYAKYVK